MKAIRMTEEQYTDRQRKVRAAINGIPPGGGSQPVDESVPDPSAMAARRGISAVPAVSRLFGPGAKPLSETKAGKLSAATAVKVKPGRSTRLTLPWPPTINHFYWHAGPKLVIKPAGRFFRVAVYAECHRQGIAKATGRLSVVLSLHAPDRRRYDIDNRAKQVLDALQHAGAYANDEQIDRLVILRGEVRKGGAAEVTITEMGS